MAGGLSPPEVVECVKAAEDAGFESAWYVEGHGGDQFSILTACALATRKIKLGTSISSVYVRTAPTIAMAAACLDYYSDGRFILGIGSSHRVQVRDEHGAEYSKPLERVRETAEVVRVLLREGAVSYQGETLQIRNFDFWFKPTGRRVPIYFAAVFSKMLELCGRMADGALMVWRTPDSAKVAAAQVLAAARAAGRNLSEVDIGLLLPCALDPEPAVAASRLKPTVAFYVGSFPRYNRLVAESGFAKEAQAISEAWTRGDRETAARLVPDEVVQQIALADTPAKGRVRVEDYRRTGITLPILFPTAAPDGKKTVMEVIRTFAA